MALEHWSSSASGNASPPGINYAEGQAPSSLNNSAREMMAQMRAKYYPTEWVWVKNSATASVASQTTFKVAGDQTAQFEANRRVRLTGGSATRFASVTSASYTTETTVTIVVDSGSLSASMSVVAISAVDQNATPAAAAVNYLSSNSASIMIAAVAMPLTGGVFTGPVGHSATASFSGAAQFNAGVSISGAMTVAGPSTFKASASFSTSAHFRGTVEFSGTASFNVAHFKSSASFSGSAHFRGPVRFSATASFGSINVSATASVGALTIGGVAVTGGAGMVLLGSKSTWPATEIKFSGSWSDYPVLVLTCVVSLDNSGTGRTPTITAYTDGGTTGFLVLNSSLDVISTSAAFVEVRVMGNGSSVKAIGTFPAGSATYTANSGFINAVRMAFNTSPTVSGGVAYLYGWRS